MTDHEQGVAEKIALVDTDKLFAFVVLALAWTLLYLGMPSPSHALSSVSALRLLRGRLAKREVGLAAGLALFLAILPPALFAQASIASFGVGKKMDYLQNAATTPTSHTIISDPAGPYYFSADIEGAKLNQLASTPKVILPNATQFTLAGSSVSMGYAANYTTKSALDAAFPNGDYTITAGSSSLPVSLGTADVYPAEIPQILNGTWDGQGKLVINATTGTTLNFNEFSAYATGTGGIITFYLYTVSGSALGSVVTKGSSLALNGYPSDPALTSYNIPAGLLQSDQTYYAEISFSRIVNLDTSYFASLGALGIGSFIRTTGLMVSTAAPIVAPTITTQPLAQSVTVGANVTLTVAASGNPSPTFQWKKDSVVIGGATFASFSLSNVQLSDAGAYSVVASNGAGVATSDNATLTVNPVAVGPVITTQPLNQAVTVGGLVTFTATATGSPAPTFQWQKDNVAIDGATNASLTLSNVQSPDAGSYLVSATNSAGTATSTPATLTVNLAGTMPVITTQPVSQTVIAGSPVALVAAASGVPTPTFQWKKNGTDIPGATGASLSISSTVGEDDAAYTVVAANSAGAVTSDSASLSVIVAPSSAVVAIAIE